MSSSIFAARFLFSCSLLWPRTLPAEANKEQTPTPCSARSIFMVEKHGTQGELEPRRPQMGHEKCHEKVYDKRPFYRPHNWPLVTERRTRGTLYSRWISGRELARFYDTHLSLVFTSPKNLWTRDESFLFALERDTSLRRLRNFSMHELHREFCGEFCDRISIQSGNKDEKGDDGEAGFNDIIPRYYRYF